MKAVRAGWHGWAVALMTLSAQAGAIDFTASVREGDASVPDAVVSLHRDAPERADGEAAAVMDQRSSQFVPGVLPIQVGTRVSFPNSDQVRHQVYSFSPAQPFELPLYAGTPAAPIRFERAGVVVVGCNIHDWMIGHIVVLDTPFFGKSGADGRVRIDAPPGNYQVRLWHARQQGDAAVETVTLKAGRTEAREFSLTLAPSAPARQGNDRLRALQEKFRSRKPAQ